MKKTAPLEQNRVGKPRTGGAKRTTQAATAVKLSPPREGGPVRLLEEHFPDSEARAVSFEYFNPTARQVRVAGSFNDWQPDATPMTKQRGGKWSAELLLKPGHHEYRLVVDGQWQDDPMAARFVANPFGGLNCVVEVRPLGTASAARP